MPGTVSMAVTKTRSLLSWSQVGRKKQVYEKRNTIKAENRIV